MNIRKNIDYSEMYEVLDQLMVQDLSQMELYCEIGMAVCQRTEKGAAVMASEYLNKHYPDVKGFSPWSLRRMRDFCCTYENHPALLRCAMEPGWIQNVVIMEAELTMELREWYMKAAKQFGWSKMELIESIKNEVHEEIVVEIEQNISESKVNKSNGYIYGGKKDVAINSFEMYVSYVIQKVFAITRCRGKPAWIYICILPMVRIEYGE